MSRIGQERTLHLPASVTSINARRQGTYVLLETHLPGQPVRNIGVYLVDPAIGPPVAADAPGLRRPGRARGYRSSASARRRYPSRMPPKWAPRRFCISLEDSLSNVIA
jgi:hypothetical protein